MAILWVLCGMTQTVYQMTGVKCPFRAWTGGAAIFHAVTGTTWTRDTLIATVAMLVRDGKITSRRHPAQIADRFMEICKGYDIIGEV